MHALLPGNGEKMPKADEGCTYPDVPNIKNPRITAGVLVVACSKNQKRYCIDTPNKLALPVNLPTRVDVLPEAASTGRLMVGDLIAMY